MDENYLYHADHDLSIKEKKDNLYHIVSVGIHTENLQFMKGGG